MLSLQCGSYAAVLATTRKSYHEGERKSIDVTPKFPNPDDGFPVIQLEDTDGVLPASVQTTNNLRYAYFKTIAKGGKCVIQSCKDLHLGRIVCYKSLHPEIADDPLEQQRFLREARVTAMLQHPNTVPIYEIGRDKDGHYYFTMKRIVGDTLREILDGLRDNDTAMHNTWDLERLMDILIQVAQALDFAHKHGVIHRDIKPENIVAGSFGEVLLLDWGLAKVWNAEREVAVGQKKDSEDPSLTSQGPLQATPLYMSPEQIRRDELDQRTDIYSFGSVLFEVLTLEQLAWGDTLDEILENTEKRNAPTPSLVSPDRDISPRLDSICLRCVAKNPDHRFPSMRHVISELLYWKRLRNIERPPALV